MDILFKKEDFVFSYRVGGILIRNGKILLQRPKNDDYAIIGGLLPPGNQQGNSRNANLKKN